MSMAFTFLDTLDDWQAKLSKERAARALLIENGAPQVRALQFRKQSHNAVVFEGELDGAAVFLKQYEVDHGPQYTRSGVEETAVVRAQMDGKTCGVADIIWASEEHAMVLMAGVAGTPVADALTNGQVADVIPQVANWLAQYIGPRSYMESFSTSLWVRKRSEVDISGMSSANQQLCAEMLALQRRRHQEYGAMPATKARTPKDFAHHNLHWTGSAVWGFDIEGYSRVPIARSIAKFCVLAERRLPNECERTYGVHAGCLAAFTQAFSLTEDHRKLLPFLIADELLAWFFNRHDDVKVVPAIRTALEAHLRH